MTSSDNREIALGLVHVDRRLLALAGALSLVVYGYELFHFTLSIDEEVYTYATDTVATWAAQGRWGMALLTAVLPRIGAVPFVSTLLFCVGLSLAAALIAPLVGEDAQDRAFFVVLLVVSPVWPHLVEFNTLSFGVGIGLCATALAVRASFREERRALATGALLLAFAVAIYQTFSLAFLVVALLAAATQPLAPPRLDPGRALRSRIARIGGVFAAGVVVYGAVNAVARLFVPPNAYIDNYLNWRDFLVDFGPSALRTVSSIGLVLGGVHPMYLRVGLVFQVLGIAGILGFAIDAARRRDDRPAGRAATVVLYLTATGIAVAPEVVAAGSAPVRALVPIPFLFAAVAARSLRLHRIRWPQWTVLGLAALTSTWISVSLFYSDAVARQRDAITAGLLASRINDIARPVFPNRIPLLMVGYLPPAKDSALRRVEVFGASFFEHDFGNPWRMAFYLRLMGIQDLEPQPVASLIPIAREVEAMPSWPRPGSVAVVDGKLVVKFGPPSFAQQREIDAARARGSASPGAAR